MFSLSAPFRNQFLSPFAKKEKKKRIHQCEIFSTYSTFCGYLPNSSVFKTLSSLLSKVIEGKYVRNEIFIDEGKKVDL